ncbi:MAG: hypothetical protein AABX98_06320 [Nanoarchaeota archaeon]
MTEIEKDLKKLLESEGEKTMVLALSAGIIAPEHEFSGPADQQAIKELTEVDISQGNWKERFRAVDGDWPQMYVQIGAEVGKPVTRGEAIAAYMQVFPKVYEAKGKPRLDGARDFVEYCRTQRVRFGILSGQFGSIISGRYCVDGNLAVESMYIAGGVIPSSENNVRDAAYGVIGFAKNVSPLRNLVLVDGNDKRLAAAGNDEWRRELGLEQIVKIGVGDKWVTDDAALGKVVQVKYRSVKEMYEALR